MLRHHDCVIVPRVGAFIVVKHEARIDYGTNSYMPPSKEICFNGSISHQDGLIASSIARKQGIPYSEACLLLDKETDTLVEQLAKDGEVAMGKIGVINLTPEGRVAFRQFYQPYKLCSLLGLPPIELSSPEDCKEIKAQKMEASFVKIRKSMLRVAAVVIMIVAASLSFLLPGVCDTSMVDYASLLPTANEGVQMSSPRHGEEFSVVVASFANEKSAREYISNNIETSHALSIVKAYGRYRVVAMRGENAEILLEQMEEGSFADIYPGAWIWERH